MSLSQRIIITWGKKWKEEKLLMTFLMEFFTKLYFIYFLNESNIRTHQQRRMFLTTSQGGCTYTIYNTEQGWVIWRLVCWMNECNEWTSKWVKWGVEENIMSLYLCKGKRNINFFSGWLVSVKFSHSI